MLNTLLEVEVQVNLTRNFRLRPSVVEVKHITFVLK